MVAHMKSCKYDTSAFLSEVVPVNAVLWHPVDHRNPAVSNITNRWPHRDLLIYRHGNKTNQFLSLALTPGRKTDLGFLNVTSERNNVPGQQTRMIFFLYLNDSSFNQFGMRFILQSQCSSWKALCSKILILSCLKHGIMSPQPHLAGKTRYL